MHPDDEAAFRAFVHARSGGLLHTARLLTGDHGAAEDLLQEALSRLAPRWGTVEAPEAYARTTMHRLQISRWRRASVREVPAAAVPDRVAPADHGAAGVHDRLVLERALAGLTARQRSVLICRYLEDLDERQTAQRLGIRVGSVRSIGARSLARLRTVLAGQGFSNAPVSRRDAEVAP